MRERRGSTSEEGFLCHINKKKEYPAKMLKLKEPRRRTRTITKDQVNQVVGFENKKV